MAKKKTTTQELPEELPTTFTPNGYRPADPPTDRPAIWSTEPEVASLILAIAANTNAKTIVEVGCFRGATTAQLASSGLDIHAVDHLPELPPMPPNVTVHTGDSIAVANSRKLPKADIIFYDSTHTFKHLQAEFRAYEVNVAAKGCVHVFHDAIHMPEVAAFLRWLERWYNITTINTTENRGVAIAVFRRAYA